jgi:putative spermidine/putrescine transport system ATP-binding protein
MLGLELQKVSKHYGSSKAVDEVSLQLPEGQFICFLGPSGCGKTTLLRMIAGLIEPTAGRILMKGNDLADVPVHKRNFGMVFQSMALFPHLSVAENIAYSLKFRTMDRNAKKRRVTELLELIKLSGTGNRSISQLSGGQRQRVAIARALAQEPSLFLMDEPLSALDAQLRDHMQVELRQLQQKLKITTILVTHDQREAMTISDMIVVMGGGVVQQVGPPMDIYSKPANRFVASFIGQSNLIDAEILDHNHVRVAGKILSVAVSAAERRPGQRHSLMIRPENVGIALGTPGAPADNTLEGRVVFVRNIGASVEVHIACAGFDMIAVGVAGSWPNLSPADPVTLILPPAHCRLLPDHFLADLPDAIPHAA